MRTNIKRATAGALACILLLGACASGRIRRALDDFDGPAVVSCWARPTPTVPHPSFQDAECEDEAAKADEQRCVAELSDRRPRLWWNDEIRDAHLACMSTRGWEHAPVMVITQ